MSTAVSEVIPDEPTAELVKPTLQVPVIDVSPDMVLPNPLPLPSIDEWRLLTHIADTLAESGVLPKGLNGRPKSVMAALLKGRELGLHPMTACTSIYIIEGLPTLSVHLMHALVKRRGHRIDYTHTDATSAVAVGQRLNPDSTYDEPVAVTWTIEMAATANLLAKDNWKHYPDAMLRARATTALVRMLFPDVLIGAWYSPDELGARVDAKGTVTALPTRREAEQAAASLGREASADDQPPRPTEGQTGVSDGSIPTPGPAVVDGEATEVEPEPELDRDELWLELGLQAAAMGKTIPQWTTRWVAAHKKNAADADTAELNELVKSRRDTVTQKIAQDPEAAKRQAAYSAEHARPDRPTPPGPGETTGKPMDGQKVETPEPGVPDSRTPDAQTVPESGTPEPEDLLLVADEGDAEAGVENHPFFASEEDPDVCADCLPITRGPDDPIHRP